jgi:hypothetical protein
MPMALAKSRTSVSVESVGSKRALSGGIKKSALNLFASSSTTSSSLSSWTKVSFFECRRMGGVHRSLQRGGHGDRVVSDGGGVRAGCQVVFGAADRD